MSGQSHLLIVGAGGLFGARLARLVAERGRMRISLGGRRESNIATLRRELGALHPAGGFVFVPIDRDAATPEQLRGFDVVVDCAGPFQGSGTTLIEACIAAGAHYVDIADGRAWVEDIPPRFDVAARAAGIAVITGASTTPALTVVAACTDGWQVIDTIDVAVVPGNRTPKGKSVIAAILSWVGKPVAVFREGRWQRAAGWTGQRWVVLDGVGRRRASLADVPDLDAPPRSFMPRIRSQFDAGMELGLLHRLIWLSGIAVRLRLTSSATLFAAVGYRLAMLLDRCGTDRGGMLVEVTGADAGGKACSARWSLVASDNAGPYVPVLAAAAVVELLLAGSVRSGARSAAGVVTLEAMLAWIGTRDIKAALTTTDRDAPLYRRLMGARFDELPDATQRLHRGQPAVIAQGEAIVVGASNKLGGLIARLFRLPTREGATTVEVVIEARDGREHWTRWFDGKPMRSVMADGRDGLIEERFGPVTCSMRLEPHSDGLNMVLLAGRVGPLSIPPPMLPRIRATERVDAQGRPLFDVEIGLPLVGRLVAYRGWLAI